VTSSNFGNGLQAAGAPLDDRERRLERLAVAGVGLQPRLEVGLAQVRRVEGRAVGLRLVP